MLDGMDEGSVGVPTPPAPLTVLFNILLHVAFVFPSAWIRLFPHKTDLNSAQSQLARFLVGPNLLILEYVCLVMLCSISFRFARAR